MAKTNYQTIDEYIKTHPEDVQVILQSVRKTIKKTAPNATEAISYQIPTFKMQGRNLVHFAAFKNHISFYPTPSGIENFKKELSEYKISKGTVQFQLNEPVPYALIDKIVRFRVKEEEKRDKSKYV
jgi:uncharacterized protein YdhG (YjbR/CyaY superfamily)